MYAIAFDLIISELKVYYEAPYNRAYSDIRKLLAEYEFYWIQGSTYASTNGDLRTLYKVIDRLKSIDWFCKSIRDIRAFKIEDYSDFTEEFK